MCRTAADKKPLQRIEIIDVDDTTMKDVNFKALCLKKDVSEEKETNRIINKTVKSEDTLNSTNNVTPKEEVLEFTNMEKTSKLKIDGRCLPTIFQDSLESDVFSSMINILSTEFVKYNLPVLNYIEGLLNIRRFEMLMLFMNKQDKEGYDFF
ncbi:uncharacterized protein LOC142321157 [Lycorma delicatula]|uniref:uncharacterized protein LOC142321157 n=1 Tax=Lycorma delicatula TaxID=130591 RepID=UPI003F5183F3